VMDTLFPGFSDPTTPAGGASANSTVYAVWAPSQIPLPILYSGDNAPAALAGAAGQAVFAWAVAEWNGIGSGMTLIPGAGVSGSSVCDAGGVADGVNTIEWRASLPDGVLGTTCAVSDGGTILGYPHYIEADIVFSAAIPWSVDDVMPADTYDWETTLLHEMGHLVGLSHTETADAVMFASLDKGVQRRSPQPDDIAGVRALYGLGVVTQANGVELAARPANMVKRAITLSVASSQ
jgi:hypothetical protein